MRNAFTSKGKTFTNWMTNADGSITERPVKVYTVGDGKSGVYELEICSEFLGLILETDFHGVHTQVKAIDSKHCDNAVLAAVTVGDVLVSVNNHVMLYEDFEDIIDYLNVLRDSKIPRRLRFVNPALCPIAVYSERLDLGKRSQSRTDVYGFVRSAEYLKDEHIFMTSNMTAMSQRDHDWIIYLKSIGGSENLKPFGQYIPSLKLKLMVRRGIPAAFRPLIWKQISLSDHYRQKFPSEYYTNLIKRLTDQLCATVQLDISKDVGRTFPDHEILNSEKGQASLSVVLSALALHNPEVGYCQSLNFIAGTLLLFLSEEDSFWLMCVILECLLPRDNYSASMTGTYLDQQVFEEVVRERLPRIDEKLSSFGLQLSLCSIQWFMCIFVNTLRMEPALRVWDIFLNEGDHVLFRVAVGLLKLHEEEILRCTDASTLYLCLKGVGTSLVDADDLIRASFEETCLADPSGNTNTATSKRFGSLYEDIANKSKAVPERLQGLGLGHLGWRPPREETTINTIPVEKINEQELGTDESNHVVSRSDHNCLDITSVSESVFTPLRVSTVEWSVPSSSTVADTASAQNAKEQSAENPYFYRQFRQADLIKLRTKFRPEVEERLLGMERNRRKWKEEREAKETKQVIECREGNSINSNDDSDDRNLLEGRTSGDCNGSTDSDSFEALSETTPPVILIPSPSLPANDSQSS